MSVEVGTVTTRLDARPDRLGRSRPVPGRTVYSLLACVAAVTTGGIWLLMIVDEQRSGGSAAVQLLVKFTNLTVLLVAVVAAWIALDRSTGEIRTVAHLTVLVMAVVTSIVNMTLLDASLPGGWWGVVDLSQHYVIPVAVVVSWGAVGPSLALRRSRLGLVLVVPLLWLVFVLSRGAALDTYPYDFVDVPETGWWRVFAAVGAILVLMLMLSAGASAIDRRRGRDLPGRPIRS